MTKHLGAGVALVATLIGFAPEARAHIFSTDVVNIVGFNTDGYVTVSDPSGCNATISAITADPNIATITPTLVDAVSLEFVISSHLTVGSTTIQFMFIGDGMPASCNEVGMHTITVNVMDVPPRSSSNNDQSGDVAEPINTFNGELWMDEPPDLTLLGPAPLEFKRYYASFLKRLFVIGDMGDNWRHNFEWRLSNVGNVLVVVNERGREMRYSRMGTITDPWMQTTGLDVPMEVVQTAPTRFSLLDPRDKRVYVFDVPPGASLIKLMEIVYPNGQKLFLTYDTLAELQEVSDNLGRTLTFTYDANGHVQTVSDGSRTVTYTYAVDELTAVTDAAGGITVYQYDLASLDPALMTRKILPRGNSPMVNTFDSVGRVATQADAYGNTLTMAYDTVTHVTTVTDAEGNVFFHEHDQYGSLITATNGTGDAIEVTNDITGRRESITSPTGGTMAMTHHMLSGRVDSVTDANGDTTTSTYAARVWPGFMMTDYDLTRIDHPDGTSETYARDARGNLLAFTDRGGHTWSTTYNAAGQPLTKTNPLGAQTTWVYDAAGRLLSSTDPAGNTTTYLENASGQLTRVTHADGTTIENTYDAMDRLLSVTDERGSTTSFVYDQNGNPLTVTDAAGNAWIYSYDDNDRLVTTTNRVGATTTRTLDGNGRLVALTDETGNGLDYEYDAAGRLQAVVDPEGGRWTLEYDAAGNLSAKTSPVGGVQQQVHDSAGLVSAVTNATGGATTLVRDAMDRVTAVTDFRGDTTLHEFDELGYIAAIETGAGSRTSMSYDALGNLVSLVDPNQGSWTFSHANDGRPLGFTDPSGASTTYAYGPRNRLSRATYPGGGTVDVTFDGVGHLTRRLYSDGLDVTYTHDVLGRLTATNGLTASYDAEGRMVSSNGLSIPRDAAGRIASVTFAPGKTVTYTYDASNHVSAVTDWLGGGVTYQRDAAGQTTAIQRDNGLTTTMAWDADGRLTNLTDGTVASLAIVRDGMGRVVVNDRELPTVFTATPGDETTFGFGATLAMTGATYDQMGRLVDDGTRTYAWDLASRATSITEGASTATFTYDGNGQLLTRTEGGVTDSYVWNQGFGLPVVSVVERNGVDETYYVHAPDGALLYRIDAADGSHTYYHCDEAGNTLFLSDDTGAVVASYAYDPYGAAVTSTPGVEELFTWGGRWGVMREGDSGLYRMRARLYDSRSMRFLSRDPAFPHVHPNNFNPYVYAAGNPLMFIDPTGVGPLDATVEAVAVTGDTADVVASSAGKTAVDLVGDGVGLVKEITKVEENAEMVQTMAESLRRIRPLDVQFSAEVMEAADANAWTRANRIASSAPMSALDKVGTATQLLDGLVEANRLNNTLSGATTGFEAASNRALQDYENQMDYAFENYRTKKWTRYQYERWRIDRWYDYRMTVLRAQEQWDLELAGGMLAGALNAMGTFVPFNPVTFESHKIEIKLPFADKALFEFGF